MQKKLPDNWKWESLGAVAHVEMGQSPPGASYNTKGAGIPFLQGKAEFGNEIPIHVQYSTLPCKVVGPGTILMSVRAPVGDVNIADQKYCIGRGLAGISSEKCDNRYLFHYLNAIKSQIESKGTGSTFKAISKSIIKELLIPVPPIDTQRRIGAILDRAEETRRLRARADELTQKLLESVFLEMFGDPLINPKKWEVVRIGDVATVKTGGTPRRDCTGYWENGTIPWLKTTEVRDELVTSTEELITEDGYNNSNVEMLPKNTIIIAMYGQGKTRGRTAKLGIELTTNQACAAILPSKSYTTDFLWYQLILSYDTIRSHGRGGNQPNLNLTMIRGFRVILPPLDLQRKFSSIVSGAMKNQRDQVSASAYVDVMHDSLIAKAFTGALVA